MDHLQVAEIADVVVSQIELHPFPVLFFNKREQGDVVAMEEDSNLNKFNISCPCVHKCANFSILYYYYFWSPLISILV